MTSLLWFHLFCVGYCFLECCGWLNNVERDGFVRVSVHVGNLQVVVWQNKFYSKKFCVTCSGSLDFNRGDSISYKGDKSTLAPTCL